MPAPKKSAKEMIKSLGVFVRKTNRAIKQTEKFRKKLQTDANFRKLWEEDSAAALSKAGINPEARQEMGLPEYSRGPECNWCITPNGNTCHC